MDPERPVLQPTVRVYPVVHGRPSTYQRGCKCPDCTRAWAVYRRPRVAEKRAAKRLGLTLQEYRERKAAEGQT